MVSTDDILPAPSLHGFRFRTYRGEPDLDGLCAVLLAVETVDGTNEIWGREAMANWLANMPDFEAERDVLIAEVEGRMVAWSYRSRRVRDGIRVFDSYGRVHPDWRRRGLGRAMLRLNESVSRARALAEDDPREAALGSWSSEANRGNVVLLESEGYEVVRWFFEMERPDLDDILELGLPEGIELRPVPGERLRDVLLATFEAFEDHWGAVERSEADIRQTLGDPDTDPSLWRVAWAGDEVAGSVINAIYPDENEALGFRRGWLDRVSVRRPWRRQGVARALIAASLVALRERGMERAALGVDADNQSGALGLYEGLGFRPIHRAMAYRKPV